MKSSVLAPDFLRKFSMDSLGSTSYLISTFFQIGQQDPFYNDHETVLGSLDDHDSNLCNELLQKYDSLVYQETRFTKDQSPICLFIPRKEIMLKLMRACISVSCPSGIWFNL
jgi:hypothetical protein